jgi:hypothetical protein
MELMTTMEKEIVRPIEEVLRDIAKEIPQEEWDKLPEDLNENLDHYLYGVPKKIKSGKK